MSVANKSCGRSPLASGGISACLKVGDERPYPAEMDVRRAVAGQRFMGPDRVELDPELLGVAGQVEHVDDVFAVEPLVLPRLEAAFPGRCFGLGS
jgi:hypothetical protein